MRNHTVFSLLALVLVLGICTPALAQSIGGAGPAVTPSQAYPHSSPGLSWLAVPILWTALAMVTLVVIRRAADSH